MLIQCNHQGSFCLSLSGGIKNKFPSQIDNKGSSVLQEELQERLGITKVKQRVNMPQSSRLLVSSKELAPGAWKSSARMQTSFNALLPLVNLTSIGHVAAMRADVESKNGKDPQNLSLI